MSKEIPAGAFIGGIIALLVVAGLAIFFFVKKGDPAMQAPNPPPRFDPVAKAAESRSGAPLSIERGPPSAGGTPQKPAMPAVQ